MGTRTLVMALCAKSAGTGLRTKRRDCSPPKTMHCWKLTGGTVHSGQYSVRARSKTASRSWGTSAGPT
jgi:hypothetical protein